MRVFDFCSDLFVFLVLLYDALVFIADTVRFHRPAQLLSLS